MKVNRLTFSEIQRPTYVIEESLLRRNLQLISAVAADCGVEIILAFKAFALWKTFPIFREYISATTASSLNEAQMAYTKFGKPAHLYSPAYEQSEVTELAHCASHVTFNSLSQAHRFHNEFQQVNNSLSFGIRINPEHSPIETLLYNSCAPGTRFGVCASQLPTQLPNYIEGFHCHCHCESSAEDFAASLAVIEQKFGTWFSQIKWINFGGGHLMTREGYNLDLLKDTLYAFRNKYPHLKVILEPGSAFAWQTGPLIAQVVDIVQNHGIKTAVLNVSFTCHMPDCLEMPYQPTVRGAESLPLDKDADHPHVYRLGGNSCLSGDFMGSWRFDRVLQPGDNVVFEDMIHYTTVKTNMFNGIAHPDIAMLKMNGELEILRHYTLDDYLQRMD